MAGPLKKNFFICGFPIIEIVIISDKFLRINIFFSVDSVKTRSGRKKKRNASSFVILIYRILKWPKIWSVPDGSEANANTNKKIINNVYVCVEIPL